MFLDWSGSMDQFMQSTIKQLHSMVLFCKRAQIPFEVYTFRSLSSVDTIRPCFDMHRSNFMQLQNFKLRNILSSRMTGADLNFAMAYLLNTRGRGSYDYLQSTPLNQAIVAAEKVIEMFRAKSKAQIINTVFLTDGDSDPISGFNENSLSTITPEERAARRKGKFILQDKKLKREYELGDNVFYKGKEITNALLRRLKDRTGVNLIGFFLTSGSFARIAAQMDIPCSTLEYRAELEKSYKDNHFFPVTSAGYEKYFVINANKMRISQNDLVVTDDMSKSKIATAFRKFSQGKSVNRVLLRQFIDLVAE
jgi:hypothetical protein